MKTTYIILITLLVFLIAGCSVENIADIKNEEHIGKTVTVTGIVATSIKLGPISGYVVSDKTGDIGVAASVLPAEREMVRVKGVLMKDTLLGYYIKVNEE